MKNLFLACIVCALALFNGSAVADGYSHEDAEKYIVAGEVAWAESVATNDASTLRRIMADDAVWVLDGKVWNKAQAVADAEAGPDDFLSDHLDYAHVRFFGDTAVVQGSEKWTRKGGRTGHFLWTDTWLLRDGKWQIVQAQDTTVHDKARRP